MENKIIVETSARHVHLTRAAVDILYGKDHRLTVKKMLSQPGQFACEEKVSVVGPKGELKMSILGPERKDCQVEVSFSDARALGITTSVRESGDIQGTPGCKIVGPAGELDIDKGVIVAKRHIHLTPETAAELGVTDRQCVSVDINGTSRPLVFGDVVVRVSDKFSPAVHIDTDESNAACASGTVFGSIIK